MDNMQSLEELGLAEVSRRTHIETKFLKYMIDKDFSKLNRVNTVGFAKILKREYNVDMDSWLDEFNAYWQEHQQTPVITSTENIITKEPVDRKSPIGFMLLLIIVVFGVAFWYFDGVKYISNFINQQAHNQSEQVVMDDNSSKEALEEANQIIEDKSYDLAEKESNINEANVSQIASDINYSEDNTSVETEVIEQISDVNDSVESNDSKKEEIAQQPKKIDTEAYIQPKRKLWMGIVNLETRKRSQYATKKLITIDLNKPQIVVTGHGKFTLTFSSGEEKSPTSNGKKYYYVDGGTMTQINKKEFITYNGGKSW